MKKICLVMMVILVILGTLFVGYSAAQKEANVVTEITAYNEQTVLNTNDIVEANEYVNLNKVEEETNFKNFTVVAVIIAALLITSFIYEIKY